jgi:ATP-dependent helicase/nuclease subunit A
MKSSPPRTSNIIIRASAGTGKTFQLSNSFLRLLFGGAESDSILATTFTRKAAGEILDRVFSRLADAALDDAKLAELRQQLGLPTLDAAQCRRALAELVRRLHRLRVGTLDSFFIEIARCFCFELGLPPGWSIADENADGALRRLAVGRLLGGQSTGDALRLMHWLTKGQAARSVDAQISTLVEDLYEIYLEAPAAAWTALKREKQLPQEELAAALDRLDELELPQNKNFIRGHENSRQNAAGENWEAFLSGGLAAKILGNEETFCRVKISKEIRAAYLPLVRHARAVFIRQIVNQNEAAAALLERFDAEYQRLKSAERLYRFDDITRRLGATNVSERFEDVFYRIDAGISHLLLDEFQDTSLPQWRVLRPLARRAADARPGRSFFCVGDVKQAIYGWRGGMAEIFDALENEVQNLRCESLQQSRRSSQPVIDCVNRIFGGLHENNVAGRYSAAAERWSRRFDKHTTARGELPGYCALATAERAAPDQPQAEATAGFAAEEIVRLMRQSPGRTIGVLVRRNAAVARLIYELRTRGVDASEEGGNPLDNSPAVELLLSLLTLGDHPGDGVARFHLANSPLAEPLGLTDHRDAAAAARLSRRVRQSLEADGYGPTILRWTEMLAPACDRRDLDRLGQLVELAHQYENQATARCDDFVELVRGRRVRNPLSSAVRVMTIHQAKGLQFDVVVLPEMDFRIAGQTPNMVVGRDGPAGEINLVCRYLSEKLRPLLPPAFREAHETHQRQVVEESLCLLYVAMTRAIHALHIIIAPSRQNEKTLPATWAGLLRAALTDGRPVQPMTLLYQHGDPHWSAKLKQPLPPKPAQQAEQPPMKISFQEPAGPAARGLSRRSPSELEGGPGVDIARLMQTETSPRLLLGTLIHQWLQQIEWLDDGLPAEDGLRAIAAAPGYAGLDVDAALHEFYAALEKPEINAALRRSAYARLGGGVECRVLREKSFAVQADDAIISGAIDRLVLLLEGGRIVAAEVLDYKTDDLPDDPRTIAARSEFYRPQLEAYRRAVARIYRLDKERISARLLFTTPGRVSEIKEG